MNLTIDPNTVIAFLMVMTRVVTVLTVAPPFQGSTVPVRVRVGIAASIGLLIAPLQTVEVSTGAASLIAAIVYQVVVGAMFGYLIQLMLSVPLIAGSMIDGLSGLSASTLFDPLSNSSATPAARLNQLLATIVLFAIEGHLLIIRGVIRSYEAAPLSGIRVASMGTLLSDAAGQLLLAAVEIALPVLVALLLTEAVLALSARAAPRLNVMVLGFAVKSIVFMLVFAVTVPLLINGISALLDRSLRWAIAGAGG